MHFWHSWHLRKRGILSRWSGIRTFWNVAVSFAFISFTRQSFSTNFMGSNKVYTAYLFEVYGKNDKLPLTGTMVVPGWMPFLRLSWLRTAIACSCWLHLPLSRRSWFLDKYKYSITSGPHLHYLNGLAISPHLNKFKRDFGWFSFSITQWKKNCKCHLKLTMFKQERRNIFTFLPVELGGGCLLVTELTLLLVRLYFFGKGVGGGGGATTTQLHCPCIMAHWRLWW